MIKVFCPAPNEDWICDVIISEMKSASRHQFVDNPFDADVIFLYAKWIWNRVPLDILMAKPVITTFHHAVPEKFNLHEFDVLNAFTDVWHVPNKHTKEFLQRQKKLEMKSLKLIPYWINDKRWVRQQLKSKKDKIILGSFQRDTEGMTEGTNNPSPKLEKGPDIFADVVEKFSVEECQPFIPGWRRTYLTKRLAKYNVSRSSKMTSEGTLEAYKKLCEEGGIYLVTSRYEGGPQAILECAALGCRILSFDVGLAAEVLHPDCICGSPFDNASVDTMVEKIKNFPEHTVEYNYESVKQLSISNVIHQYDDMIDGVFVE
jgi:glycosyltransferase involved in cell wall biosynthesis